MSDYSELKRLAEAALRNWPDSKLFERPECESFIDSARPDVVLALIAEVEGLRAQHGRDSAELRNLCQARYDARKERDQLKAEVEALRNLARELRGSAECTNVHHCKSEQHDLDEPCKVLARIDAAMSKGDQP